MRILIVEDEPMILKGIAHLVGNYPYENGRKPEIIEAYGGLEGDRYLENESFHIVFTDIRMPDVDGLTLLKKWSRQHVSTKWVIISGYDDFKYAQEAIVNGVKDYLLKPVTKHKMKQTLDRLLSESKQQNDSFVGVDESERIVAELQEAIWLLDQENLSFLMDKWFSSFQKRNMDIAYLEQYMNQLIRSLHEKLNAKSQFRLEAVDFSIKAQKLEQLKDQSFEACMRLQSILKSKRNRNMIEPIEAAKKYIMEHLGDSVSLEDVARKVGFNTTYFSQMFKRETGESFAAYRKRLRMEKAKELLEKGDMRIVDISVEIGYGDLPHFTKTFKQYTGYTPSEYRMKMGVH